MQDIKSKTNKKKENLILNTYIDQILLPVHNIPIDIFVFFSML